MDLTLDLNNIKKGKKTEYILKSDNELKYHKIRTKDARRIEDTYNFENCIIDVDLDEINVINEKLVEKMKRRIRDKYIKVIEEKYQKVYFSYLTDELKNSSKFIFLKISKEEYSEIIKDITKFDIVFDNIYRIENIEIFLDKKEDYKEDILDKYVECKSNNAECSFITIKTENNSRYRYDELLRVIKI